jgi:hypothetical protein
VAKIRITVERTIRMRVGVEVEVEGNGPVRITRGELEELAFPAAKVIEAESLWRTTQDTMAVADAVDEWGVWHA